MNDNINKIQKILQNKVGYQGSSADLMKYLETPENKEKLVKILNTKVGYEGTVDDFNRYVGLQVPKVEGIQNVSAPSVTVGAPEVNVMSPLASNAPTAPKVDWAAQEDGSITKPIGGELEREQPVNFEGMTPDPKNNPDYSVTNQSGKFVYTFDKEKSDHRKENEAYLTLLDEQMKASNKRLEESMAAVKKYNAENPTSGWENFPVAYGGAAFAQHEREKQKITGGEPQGEIFATQAILKDAEQAFKAPKKGENWAKSFGIGGAETVTDPDAWLFGILSLNEVQQSMSVFEKVEKGEPLTDTESALMDAMLTRTQAEAMRSSDTSNWYKGGKIAGESLPFMRDMAMTGGLNTITTAAGKGSVKLAQRATAKYLRNKAEKQLLKEGIDITEDILSRRAADLFMRTAKVADYSGRVLAASTVTPAVRTPLMPTSYSGVAKNMQPKVVGDEFGTYQIQEGDDFGTAVGKQFVEVQSEGVGEFFAPILKGVKLLGGKAIPKVISDSKFGQVGSKVVDAIMLDNPYLQKAGVSGIAGEVGEEIFGQTEQYLSGLTTKEDLDNFYSGDNFKSMLIGFAPMSALGIAGNAINYGSNEVQYRRAKKELGGITDELDNSSVGELGNKISDVLIQNNAFDEDGNLTEEGRQLNNNLVSYAQRKMAKDIANDGKQENPNSKYYDFLLNERSKKWLESYLADNDLTVPMYFNLAYKATLHENELTDYERKTLSELDRAFNGYLKAEDAAQQASAEIDTQVNPTNNKIQNVMVGGQPYIVKGGNIVMTENEEGKAILDKENSDQVITVVNAEGIPLQIGIEQLESVVGEVDAEEAKNAAIESAHTTAYNETFYPVGSIVYRKDAQGQFSAIKETGADGFTINSVTEGGEAVPTLIENTNSENFGVISLKAGDKYTLNDGTQLDIISNEDGVISASVNGQPSEQTTADELATLFESTGIDLTQFEPVEEDVAETEVQEPQQPVETQQVEETQQVQETEAPEVYPTDKKGEPIFEQMPVEQSIKVVREVLGDDAVNFVEDKLKAADKAVKAVAKKAPKSTSLLGRKSEVEAIALEKQKATESLDYWTNVKRLMSEEAIQATREQTPTNQVVENPNQVGQVIIDRYESAKKVIGNSATITAPNGEVLKGRYVLVSAYAVTPSHNPFDGYNTSEGFPLNADGSNTNQRDYKNDKANQVVTDGIGGNFDGRALENIPKVSKRGVVFDHNGTTMASQLAAANGTDKAYLEALNNNAANYGFTSADLKSISNPRIVLELETELPYTTETFAMFNSEEKKSESATASAVAKSKQLSPSSVAKIAALVDSYSSLESFFSSETATAEMVKTLVDAKVINTLEIAKLIDNGLFSATGRELITNVLLGATLNEQAIRQIGNDSSLKGIIVRAMKQILENAKLKEYSLFEDINNAIGLLYEARKAKMSVSDFLLQTNMFEKGASERFSDFEQMLALAMSDSGVLFKGTIDKYNTVAAPLVGGQVDMFTGRILDPNEVKQQIIEYYGKTKSIINPNAGVDGRNRGSETTRTETTRTGRTDSGRISLASAQAMFDAATTTEEKYKAALEITLILDEQNNTKTIVAKDNEDFISMLPSEYAEEIREERVAGVFFKGQVIINAEKALTGEEILLAYEHEYAHNANRNVHSSDELDELWNNSTDKKILPRVYLGYTDNIKGDELIAHIIEDIIQKQGYENYKNGNIDLSLYSQQEQLKKTIDYANKEYLRNVRGGNSRGNLYEDNNARKADENLQQTDEGRQTPKFRRKNQGELTEGERNVQKDVSKGSSRVRQAVTTETLLIDGVERPTRNSNGAYIHSTEEGVRNFYAWFGNSKVVDEQGRPLVVYHFGKFGSDGNYESKGRIHLGTYQAALDRQELLKRWTGKSDGEIKPYYLKISNPKHTKDVGNDRNWSGEEFVATKNGNDGLLYENKYEEKGSVSYVVWQPTQIKSATGNTGEFSENNADIRFKIQDESKLYQDARKYNNYEDFISAYKESDFRDSHSSPGQDNSPIEEKLEHGGDFSLVEVAKGFHNQPDDYFAPRIGARYYGYDDLEGMQSYTAINNVIRAIKAGKKDITITAYRAVPKEVELDKLIDRDWVTFSKEYAIGHGEHRFGEDEYKIIEQEVSPSDLWWDGNDINEWGYDTGETKSYSHSELKSIWEDANKPRFSIKEEAPIIQDVTDTQIQVNGRWYAKGIFKELPENPRVGDVVKELNPETDISKSKRVIEEVVSYFGTTDDFNEVGYLTTDGKMIDFSGKRFGAVGGRRQMDHREIADVEITDMVDFMGYGNIRMKPESNGFEITKLPTSAQLRALKQYIRTLKEGVFVDFSKPGIYGIEFSKEYPKNTNVDRIINDIIRYYNEGIKPVDIGLRFSIKPLVSEIGFYSTVEKALNAIQQEKGTKEQFKKMLLNNGARQAEMDWMGFDELPEKLTKVDIQNWIDENRIEVEEVEKSKGELTLAPLEDEEYILEIYHAGDPEGDYFGTVGEIIINGEGQGNYKTPENKKYAVNVPTLRPKSFDTLQEAKDYVVKNTDLADETKYSQYVLPGGENYKELLLTMPSKRYGLSDEGIKQREQNTYRSSHFEEPNILAHVRFDEREVNGERVLFIEEIQSDWAASNRKELNKLAEPDRIRKQVENIFGTELSPVMPFELMDAGVMSVLHYNQVRKDVISRITVDVMNDLDTYKLSADDILSNNSVNLSPIPIEARYRIGLSLLNALRDTGTLLRTELLRGGSTGGDKNILSTLNASDLSSSEIVSVLSPDSIYHDDIFSFTGSGKTALSGAIQTPTISNITGRDSELNSTTKTGGNDGGESALSGTKTSGISLTGLNEKLTTASLAKFLNWHNNLKLGNVKKTLYKGNAFVDNTKDYVNISLRRMMRYAAENGFARIAWANGTQQADRYDLSKQVDKVNYKKLNSGKYEISIRDKKVAGKTGQWKFIGEYSEPELDNVVGKELAGKIVIDSETKQEKEYSGLDLKVGGEGMGVFYDAIVPSAMSKLGKPFGAKVETIEIPETGIQQSIPVTDSMKETVMEGIPLFKISGEQKETKLPDTIDIDGTQRPTTNSNGKQIHSTEEGVRNFYRWFGESQVVDEQGRPLVVYHTTNNEFTSFNIKKSKEGFFFSPNKERLSVYNKSKTEAFYLSIDNPSHELFKSDINYLKEKGYNGIMDYGHAKKVNKDLYEIVAFNPEQIKSATGNDGSFGADNADIRFSIKAPKFESATQSKLDAIEKKYNETEYKASAIEFGISDKGNTFGTALDKNVHHELIAEYLKEGFNGLGYTYKTGSEPIIYHAKSGTIYVKAAGREIRISDHIGRGGIFTPTNDIYNLNQAKEILAKTKTYEEVEAINKLDREKSKAEHDILVAFNDELKERGLGYKVNNRTYQPIEEFIQGKNGIIDVKTTVLNNGAFRYEYLAPIDSYTSFAPKSYMDWYNSSDNPRFSIKAPKFESGASLKEMVTTSNMFIAARADKYGAKGRRMVESEIKTVGRAISEQSANLKESANLVTDMVKALLNNGSMNNMTRAELSQILTNVRNASNEKDSTVEIDNISSIVQKIQQRNTKRIVEEFNRASSIARQIQLRNAKRRFNDLMKFKVQDKNAKGISIASTVDDETVSIITTIRKSLKELTLEDVENQINEINNLDKKTTSDETKLVGLGIARDYMNEIKTREAQLSELSEELSKAKDDLVGKEGKNRLIGNQLVNSIEVQISQVKSEMTSAYDDLSARLNKIIAEGKEALKNIKLKDKENVEGIRHDVNSDMKGIEPKNNPEKGRTFKQWLKSNLIISPLQSLDFMLRSLAPNQVAGNGYLHDRFARGILKASQDAYEGTEQAFKMIDEAVAKIFGDKFTFRYISARDFKKMSKYELTYGTEKSSTTITATNGQLAYVYAVNKMTDGAMKLRAMGISEEQVEEMKAALPVRIVKLVDAIQDEILPKLRVKYNNAHLEIFNTSMASIENYFPLHIDKTSLTQKVDLEEESNKLSGLIKNSTKSIIKRTVNTKPIDIRNSDFSDILTDHIKDMEQWAAFASIRRDMNTLLSNRNFLNRLIELGGFEYMVQFKRAAAIAVDVYQPLSDSYDTAITGVARTVATSKVMLNLYTAFKQTLSVVAYLTEPSPKFQGKVLVNLVKGHASFKWAKDNLPDFRKRWESSALGDEKLSRQFANIASEGDFVKFMDASQKVAQKYGMYPNKMVDSYICAVGAKSLYETNYDRYISMGATEEKARERALVDAANLYNTTQQSSESMFVSSVQLDRTFFSTAYTVFNNSSLAYNRQVFDAAKNLKNAFNNRSNLIENRTKFNMRTFNISEEAAKKAATKEVDTQIMRDVLRLAVFGYGVQLIWRLGASFPYLLFGDDDDKKKKIVKEAATGGALITPIRGLLFGATFESFIDAAMPVISALLAGETFESAMSSNNMNMALDRLTGNIHPVVSDVDQLAKAVFSKSLTLGKAGYLLVNLFTKLGFGIDLKAFSNATYGFVELMDSDELTANDVLIDIMSMLSVPQSQLKALALDNPETFFDRYIELKELVDYGLLAPVLELNPDDLNNYIKSGRRYMSREMKEKVEK